MNVRLATESCFQLDQCICCLLCSAGGVQLVVVAAGGGQLWVRDEINVCLKSLEILYDDKKELWGSWC